MIPTAVQWGFCFTVIIIIRFETQYDTSLEVMFCHVLFYQPLHTSRSEKYLVTGEYRSKYKLLRASRLSRSASICVYVEVLNGLTSNNNSQ